MRNDLEHKEQVAFVEWFNTNFPDLIIYAIPNGGKRGIREAEKLRLEGVLKGTPDLCILLPRGVSLYIEMKQEKGTLKKHQKDWIDKAENLQHNCIVAYSAKEASSKFLEFLKEFYKKSI